MRFLIICLLGFSAWVQADSMRQQQMDLINQQPQEQLQKLLDSPQDMPEHHFYLAYAYYRIGNADNTQSHSQTALDKTSDPELRSRLYLLQALNFGVHKRDTNKALALLEQAEQSLPESQDPDVLRLKMDILESFAQAYNQKGLQDKALEYARQSLALALKHQAPQRELDARVMLGRLELQNNQLATALNEFELALVLARTQKNDKALAAIYVRLGMLYQKINQHKAAIAQFSQAVELYKQLQFTSNLINTLTNLGDSLLSDHQQEAAEQQYQQALELAQQAQDPFVIGTVYVSQSELATERGDLVQAKELLEKAYQLFSQNNSLSSLKEVSLFLVSLYIKQQDLAAAAQLLTEVGEGISAAPKFLQKRYYELSAQLAEQQQNWQQAYQFERLANEQEQVEFKAQQQLQANSLQQSLDLHRAVDLAESQLASQKQYSLWAMLLSLILALATTLLWLKRRFSAPQTVPQQSGWRQFQELVAQSAPGQMEACVLVITPADLSQQLLRQGPDLYQQLPAHYAPLSQLALFYCWHEQELWLYSHQLDLAERLAHQAAQLGLPCHTALVQLKQFAGSAQALPDLADIRYLIWQCWALAQQQTLTAPYHATLFCPSPISLSWHKDSLKQDLFNAISLGQLELVINQESIGARLQYQLRQI
ncbi:tetratricopeptide repeat protein [Rheinheimera marina]|uniref:Tetratricopeptide repeat protein n=1 Tax=Rheinheimera marina TaxID=1774958 RepID=A0ABV9JP49_9GAMM